jgi:hypothetical protein
MHVGKPPSELNAQDVNFQSDSGSIIHGWWCPISGEKDRHTTVSDTNALFELARTSKQIWLIPNVGHYDLCQAAPAEYETRVLAFLDQMSKLQSP